jgi:hypothetical protein
MTRANQWLVFGGALSVGAGFLSGMMFGRRTAPVTMVAFGRTFRVSSDIFVDSAALEYLKARADEYFIDGRWTRLRFTDRWMHLELFHEGQLFPGQQGPVYALRSTNATSRSVGDMAAAANDAASRVMLRDLEKFGLLLDGGRWGGWHALELRTIAAQQEKEKG